MGALSKPQLDTIAALGAPGAPLVLVMTNSRGGAPARSSAGVVTVRRRDGRLRAGVGRRDGPAGPGRGPGDPAMTVNRSALYAAAALAALTIAAALGLGRVFADGSFALPIIGAALAPPPDRGLRRAPGAGPGGSSTLVSPRARHHVPRARDRRRGPRPTASRAPAASPRSRTGWPTDGTSSAPGTLRYRSPTASCCSAWSSPRSSPRRRTRSRSVPRPRSPRSCRRCCCSCSRRRSARRSSAPRRRSAIRSSRSSS